MRGVGDEVGAHVVGDVAEGRVVDVPGIGDRAADDRLRAVGAGQRADLVVVDEARLRVDAVGHEVEPAAREVRGRAVGEVAAVREPHREDGVAGAQQGGVRGEDRRGAGVGLHIGVLGAEERPGPVDGDPLGHVDELAAAVVAGAGVALGVLVGERGAEGREDGRRREVLGGDQLQRRGLPGRLAEDDLGDLGVLPTQHVEAGVRVRRTGGGLFSGDRHLGLRASRG